MVRMVCGTNDVTAGLSGTDDDDADVRDDESRSLSLNIKRKLKTSLLCTCSINFAHISQHPNVACVEHTCLYRDLGLSDHSHPDR